MNSLPPLSSLGPESVEMLRQINVHRRRYEKLAGRNVTGAGVKEHRREVSACLESFKAICARNPLLAMYVLNIPALPEPTDQETGPHGWAHDLKAVRSA